MAWAARRREIPLEHLEVQVQPHRAVGEPRHGSYDVWIHSDSPAEAIALPFHRLATDFFQLHFGRRMEVAWLERREDLERILLDPSVRAVFLAGHGAMDGYSHAGLKGKPEETLARLLAWLRAQGDETLAPLAEALTVANAAGGLTCTRRGAMAALPSRDEVQRLLRAEGRWRQGAW